MRNTKFRDCELVLDFDTRPLGGKKRSRFAFAGDAHNLVLEKLDLVAIF